MPPPTDLINPKPRSKIHDVGCIIMDDKELRNLIAMDLPGRFPITSARGYKYIFVMLDYDSDYINAIPMTSRKTSEMLRCFKECYDDHKNAGLTARLLRLDNEVSQQLINEFNTQRLEYQLASPGDHRLNPAERAIQELKKHFISILAGADPAFPKNN